MCLVEMIEKWRIKIKIKTLLFGLGEKWENEKSNLYKFSHMPCIKNSCLVKKKNKQTTQIFSNHAQLKRQRQPPLPLDAVVTSQI